MCVRECVCLFTEETNCRSQIFYYLDRAANSEGDGVINLGFN